MAERIGPPWDAPSFAVRSDPPRRAARRWLQSWYREHVLKTPPGPDGRGVVRGNLLTREAVERDPTLNFLRDEGITELVERRIASRVGAVDGDRLRRNLLSSMPLCFNLFGYLDRHRDVLAGVLTEATGLDVARVDDVRIEWSPDSPEESLGDATAFDAFICYRDSQNRHGFLGVETKYTEAFSPKEYESERYDEVTADPANGFRPGAARRLRVRAVNQLWRNAMLVCALRKALGFAAGHVVVVALADDPAALEAIRRLRDELLEPESLVSFAAIEALVARAALEPRCTSWAEHFTQRYLDLSPVASCR